MKPCIEGQQSASKNPRKNTTYADMLSVKLNIILAKHFLNRPNNGFALAI